MVSLILSLGRDAAHPRKLHLTIKLQRLKPPPGRMQQVLLAHLLQFAQSRLGQPESKQLIQIGVHRMPQAGERPFSQRAYRLARL